MNDLDLGEVLTAGEPRSGWKAVAVRWGVRSGVAVCLLMLAWLAWHWATDRSGVKRKAPEMTAIIPLPPPPPVPKTEPRKEPDEIPPKQEQLVEKEPTPVEKPTPSEEKPLASADTSPEPMQMDAQAQAGGDAFNIGAGTGSGMGAPGSGGVGAIGSATYGQYLGYVLQKILRESEATRNLVYKMAVDMWISRSGEVTRVDVVRSSGDASVDSRVLAVLRGSTFDQHPLETTKMPAKVSLNSRRPL